MVQGLVFGRDVAFTYGPLGFVCFSYDIGNMAVIAMVLRLILFGCFCASVAANLSFVRSYPLAICYVAVTVLCAPQKRYIDPLVLLAVAGFCHYSLLKRSVWAETAAAILAGVALMIKFNTGVACALTMAACGAIELASDRSRLTLMRIVRAAGISVLSLIVAYVASGNPIGALGDYFRYSSWIAAGYSAQLSLHGPGAANELWCVGGMIVLIIGMGIGGAARDRRYLRLLVLLGPALFVITKSSLVRQDFSHVVLFMSTVPAIACLFLPLARSRLGRVLTSSGVLAVLAISLVWNVLPGHPQLSIVPDGPVRIWEMLNWNEFLRKQRDRALVLRNKRELPSPLRDRIGDAPVDAYPMDAAYPIVMGLHWSPRPVFQSYQAYTPQLDQANAAHYRSDQGPRFVFYSHEAIDRQHPMMVDPATWLELYSRFDWVDSNPTVNLLERRSKPRLGSPVFVESQTCRFDEQVPLPQGMEGLLMLKANIKLAWGGVVAETLHKVYPPAITIDYENGERQVSRLAWRNTSEGFLVSDLPTTLDEVHSLWTGGVGKRVRAVTFIRYPNPYWEDFQPTIELSWYTMSVETVGDSAPER